ncbi:hypothetical protein SDC9_154880 [bioreactor metagenome]|uniref:Uncharacterized protein n=1 Tax=bioreactor metagenome TaxID=1076179 RepID=A0A645F2E7_9ZZZZ
MGQRGVARGQRHHQLVFPGGLHDQAIAHLVGHGETCVVQLVAQPLELLGQRHLEQADLDVRVFLPAARQQARQLERRHAVGQRDAQLPLEAIGRGLHALTRLFQDRKHARHMLQKKAARQRQPRAAAGAHEQLHAQVFLQLPDGARQRRLLHVQPLGGAGKVKLLGHRQKTAQMPNFHGTSFLLLSLQADLSDRAKVLLRPANGCAGPDLQHLSPFSPPHPQHE